MANIKTFSALQSATGELRVKFDAQGTWSNVNAAEFAAALVGSALPVSSWSLWIDGFPKGKTPKIGATVSAADFAALVDDAESFQLIRVMAKSRSGARFPVAKLKLNKARAHQAYMAFNAARKSGTTEAAPAAKRVKI